MIRDVFESSWSAMWRPEVLGPSAAATVGAQLAVGALGADREFWLLPVSTMPWVVLVVCLRFWIGVSVMATALGALRDGSGRAPIRWVALPIAFEAGVVSLALTVPILAMLVFLVIPGFWLALRWSQAVMLILDGEAAWFEAAADSAVWTDGRKAEILLIWVTFGAVALAGAWLGRMLGEMTAALSGAALLGDAPGLILRIGTDTAGLALAAALYHELDRRPATA